MSVNCCTCISINKVKLNFAVVVFERFLLTWGYPSSALTCRACYAVSPGELHVRELCYVLPSNEPIQRVIIGVFILSPVPGALPLRQEWQAAAAASPPVPHGAYRTVKPEFDTDYNAPTAGGRERAIGKK